MKRRNFLKQIGVGAAGIMLVPSFVKCNSPTEDLNFNWGEMERLFMNPPDSAEPWVFWQWMNGNITKEGITLDLEAMKRMGIGGALCFNNAVGIPAGPVDYASSTWFEMTEYAVGEAARLGIEMMIHNSPGYSGTGGPWITPEMSMQQLVWTETQVKGQQSISVHLPQPHARMNWYRDAFVLAYPSLPVENGLMKDRLSKILVNGKEIDKAVLLDGNAESKIRLEQDGSDKSSLLLVFNEAFEARSITILRKAEIPHDLFDGPRDHPPRFELEVSDDGRTFRNVASFSTPQLREMDTPAMQNFEAVSAQYYRVVTSDPTWISNIELHSGPRLAGWPGKANWTHGSDGGNKPNISSELIIDPEKVVDLTSKLDQDGQLEWEAPVKGNWTILRIGHTTTGEEPAAHPDAGKGLEIDKFSREALDFHIEHFNSKLVTLLKPYIGKNFLGFTTDSWEAGKQNWTMQLPAEFKQRTHYDIRPWVLAMTGRIVAGVEQTERFFWDLNKVQADLLAENYYGHWSEWCHRQGLQYHAEPYGDGNLDSMKIGQFLDVPMSEFWTRNIYGSPMTSKQAASIGNVYGKPVVAAESFTGMPATSKWTDYPYSLKAEGDWFYTLGVNRLVFHVFVHQPYTTGLPGMTMGPFGTHFDRNNTWTEQAFGWINHLRRSQFLLQQGLTVADICYFQGDNPHSGVPDIYPLMPKGIRGDVVGRDALFNRFSIQNGKIVLPDGMTYSLCMMEKLDAILPDTVKRLKELVDKGMTLVVQNKPQKSPGMNGSDEDIQSQVDELFGDLDGHFVKRRSFGKGSVYWNVPLSDVLKELPVESDFLYTSQNQDATIHYLHKKIGGAEVYFVSNHKRRKEKIHVSLRVNGLQPEIWNSESGETYVAPMFETKSGRLEMPLELDPAGSVFIILKDKQQSGVITQITKDGTILLENKAYAKPDPAKYKLVQDDFSVALWIKPDTYAHGGRSMLFHSANGEEIFGEGHAICGLGAGQNGVFVYEQASNRANQILTFDEPLEGWTHLVLNYRNGTPELYVNGEKAAIGKKSPFHIHPGLEAPAEESQFISYFEGNYTKPQLEASVLSESDIKMQYRKGLPDLDLLSPVWLNNPGSGQLNAAFLENGNYELYQQSGEKVMLPIKNCLEVDLTNSWQVSFPEDTGAPSQIKLDSLKSLIKHEDFGVRHFSGTCTYQKKLMLDSVLFSEGRRFFLDLGRVEVIARVFLNGREVSLLWKEPFVADITDFVNEGENELQVEITNLWANRLIGDEHLPVENEYSKDRFIFKLPDWYVNNQPKPGKRITFSVWHNLEKEDPLLESGLLGPVKLICAEEKSI
ncbi:glycosyl hydrolase [Gaoshiqia sediminis]|uniref:Glycosyl hydrolase n=1 Tax=Gaoshiqia sediminis TaxID=2986998 RepID=A0AA42C6C8_9BACT|nr:glycosyl hydrolase [Gaoshiqia sediminis]MCW0482389.1 glycosyl hydrolase [Gaoshiqia sediminis]